jgi:hypothetical protein
MEVELLVLSQDNLLELLQMLVDQGVVCVGLLGHEGCRDGQGLGGNTTKHVVETLHWEWETWRSLELKSLVKHCCLGLRNWGTRGRNEFIFLNMNLLRRLLLNISNLS